MFNTILHAIAVFGGICFVYSGLFLYEKEENEIHNRLENWWIFLDAKAQHLVKHHSNIIQRFAALALEAINKICGRKVFSFQSFFANVCISVISVSSISIIGTAVLVLSGRIPFDGTIRIFTHEGADFIVFATLLFLPLISWVSNKIAIWETAVASAWVLLYILSNEIPQDLGYFIMPIVWAICILILMTLCWLSKMVLNMVKNEAASAASIAAIITYCIIIIGTLITAKDNYTLTINADHHGRFFVSSSNILQIILIYLGFFGFVWLNFTAFIFATLSLLVTHSVIWESINRPLYSISRFKLFNRHKTLVGIGMVLIVYGANVPSLITKIISPFLQ